MDASASAERSVRGCCIPEPRTVELDDGSRVSVRECACQSASDSALPAVLLHGLGATAALNWLGAFEAVAVDRRVLAFDLLGHGRTRCRGRFSLERAADQVAAALSKIGVDEFIAVGYSMGGVVAQLLARNHAASVRGLVLCATARDFRGRPADRLRFRVASAVALATRVLPAAPLNLVASQADGRDGDRWWTVSEAARSSARAVSTAADELGRFSSRDWVGTLDMPAAVVVTNRDRTVPVSRQIKLASAIERAHVVPIEGDHLVAFRHPQRFGAVLRSAIARVDAEINTETANLAA